VSRFQKLNPIPPPRIVRLEKDELINYRYTIESSRSNADVVKSSIERDEDLIKGVWNTCSYVLDEWGIAEIKEYLEPLTSKIEVVEKARNVSVTEIRDLAVLDSESMHFSVISPANITTRVDENAQIAKKGFKEMASLIVQSCLHSQLTKGPGVEELMELNDEWVNWERSMGKASGL
jgi:hypothetical protein